MFLKEKIKIWFAQSLKSFRYHLIFWNISLFFYLFLTGDETLFINYFGLLPTDSVYTNTLLAALLVTLLFTFLDVFFSERLMRLSPIRNMVFLRSFLYFALAFAILFLAANKSLDLYTLIDYQTFLKYVPDFELKHFRFTAYFYLACIANSTFREMYRKIGVGNFVNWFFGRLNKPTEENKIFMFIDMKSSTTKAEVLGHKKFSRLVQDVFNDMQVMYNYYGEIYQYMGDGAIVTWKQKKGLKDNNCIKAFYAFLRVIERRARYYRRKYGEVPQFKAGLHMGKVMVLQVGSIRRDISYNGDTINTAARIESACSEFRQNLLISGVLFEALSDKKELNTKEVGNIKLRGKKRGVLLYNVKLKTRKRKRKKKIDY
ncbi:adenylate cyclase [Saccharicrinis carchari]|uniref:Adenylate cyclase n=1 Tax=Saccharicrinis carchari TaxID=1168039 RepID=A0A521DZN3_SACCC|nr:adenylate/guanylate cyclase domain-containing protein [Saccharicrinis carchari]SMO77173.1 adenylate cyclase [Saccharicrinis carchari]